MTMKNCTKCNLLKSLDGFYKRKRSKDGRESFCKECRLSHNRKWILDNKAKQISAETGIPHDVDHIIPLRGKTVSGLHVPENLQILKSADNKRKAAKFLQI